MRRRRTRPALEVVTIRLAERSPRPVPLRTGWWSGLRGVSRGPDDLGGTPLVLNQVPAELAKPLYRQLQQQVRTYAARVFVEQGPSKIS
jgi:hypothetical protein